MKDDVPVIYWTFRLAWTVVHFVVVAVVAAFILTWALEDDRVVRAFEPAQEGLLQAQERVSNVIPWPWAADGGGGSDAGIPDSEDEAISESTNLVIVAITNLNVRVAPRRGARVVTVLKAGRRVVADCYAIGSLVEGPNESSRRWDHLPRLGGYVADPYVSTITSDLPRC